MAYLNVSGSITVTDVSQNTVTVNYTTDKTLTDIKLSIDNGLSYKDKTSMTTNSATFDITGVANGNYTCLLKGYYKEEAIPETIPVTSVSLSKTSHTFTDFTTLQLTATVNPTNATNKNVTWSSNNTSVATVSSTGLVTAKKNGNTIITATTQDGSKTATCNITVNKEETSTTQASIVVNQSSYTVAQGKDLSIDVTMSKLPGYPVFELRQNGEYLCSAYKNNDTTVVAYTSSLSANTYNNVTVVAKEYRSDTGYVDIAISNLITITVEASSSGGGSSDGEDNENVTITDKEILAYMYPMPQPHEAIPNGAPYAWQRQTRWENQTKPSGWSAFGGWAQVYRVEGTPFSQNTGVELKDYQVYGWKNGQWHLVAKFPAPSGYFYAEDFQDDAHTTFAGKMLYYETSVAIRLTEDMTVQTSTGTKNVCYHPFTTHLDYDPDYEYIFTCVSMRKIKWDEHGIDDRDSARYCASCGGDWWREKGLTWAPDWSNNKGIAQPKIMEVTNNWKLFAMTTVPESWTNGFPI